MEFKLGKWTGKLGGKGSFSSFARIIVAFQIFVDIVVLLDVPYLRQFAAFIFLTFIPGLVIMKSFEWDKASLSEVCLFSVGLSIVLSMFLGFLLNELYPAFGFAQPLRAVPLLVALNLLVLLPCFLGPLKNARLSFDGSVISVKSCAFAAIPFLSVIGVYLVNISGNNIILLLMISAIVAIVTFGTFYKKLLPVKLYPFVLFAITLALVFHTSLITNYITGWDIHSEYHVFKLTENAGQWNSALFSWDDRIARGNAMLSVTVLPTVYSQITGIDGTLLFKAFYPFIFAFVPVALFTLYSERMKKEAAIAAFLSVFFLVSNSTFFGTQGIPTKQMIAELFFVLLFVVLLKEKMGAFERNFLFLAFSFGLVVSHYSMSYIFLAFIFLVWILPKIANLITHRGQRNSRITLSAIVVFFTLTFAWYIYTSSAAPFDAVVGVAGQVYDDLLVDFLNPSARTPTVLRGLGASEAVSFGHQIGRIFFYAAELFIVIGVVKMLFKREEQKFGQEYALLSYTSLGLLVLAIVLPNFARFFRMERFYQIAILFLAPFCILGGATIFRFIIRRKNQVLGLNLVLLVLIPFLLFETGFIYEITGDVSYSLPLSMYRMSRVTLSEPICREREVVAAQWLSEQRGSSNVSVYADHTSAYHVLTSYGMMSGEVTILLSNTTTTFDRNSYVYLREANTLDGLMVEYYLGGMLVNISAITPLLNEQNTIYSNGGAEVLRTP